jgi:hypothetical protein
MICDHCKSPINEKKAKQRMLKKDKAYNIDLFKHNGLCACGNMIRNINKDEKIKE